jgi:hypothetical protein
MTLASYSKEGSQTLSDKPCVRDQVRETKGLAASFFLSHVSSQTQALHMRFRTKYKVHSTDEIGYCMHSPAGKINRDQDQDKEEEQQTLTKAKRKSSRH